MGKKFRWAAAAGAVLAAFGVTAGSSSGHGVRVHAAASPSIVAVAKANLKLDYAGTDRALPKTGPKAAKNKSVWVISCTQAGAGCALPAEAAVTAGKLLGWNMTLADGQYNPAVYNQQIRAAIAAKANAIILVAFDCADVQGSLQAAKAAGIKIYGLYAFDCSDVGKANEFDGSLSYGPFGGYKTYIVNSYAKAIADYAIAKTNGHAKVIELRSDDLAVVKYIDNGFEKEFAKCKTCTLYQKLFTGADFLGGKLQGFTSAMIAQHPDATVVFAPYDAAILLGMGAAVAQSNAQGHKLVLLGGEGLPPNITLMKQGLQTAAFGLPTTWAGWAAIDGLNRVFHNQKQVDAGIGHQTMDLGHNLPTGPYGYCCNVRSKRFEKNYRHIWGITGG